MESRDGGAWEQEWLCGTAVLEPWQKAFVPKCFRVLCAPTLPPVLDFDADVPVMLQFVIQKLSDFLTPLRPADLGNC